MPDLPSGTVTLLFTDIEGTNPLSRLLGDAACLAVLVDHQRLLREAFTTHHGYEVVTWGDGFFVAFERASDALQAAVTAQRALAAHPWPLGATVRVRMGLHTGQPLLTDGSYSGLDVRRASRIASVAHGGQIVLSQTTADLVQEALGKALGLRGLGEYALKDFEQPLSLFQLIAADLPDGFPPLRSARPKAGADLPVTTPPALFGRYQLRGELGRGGFATVYRAWDPALQREVALKALNPHLAEEPDLRRRFLVGAQALSQLQHPNLLDVLEVDEVNGYPFLVTKLLGADTALLPYIIQRGPLPAEQAIPIVRQLASVLDYLHGEGVVHGTAWPNTIWVTEAGFVTLEGPLMQLSPESPYVGNPRYCAPEQIESGAVQPATDIYAVGEVAYELLTGRMAFPGDPLMVIGAKLSARPVPSGLGDLPPAAAEAITRALAVHPGQRPASAMAFVALLLNAYTR